MSGRSSSLQPLFSKSFALDLYNACLYIHIHTACQSLGQVRNNSNAGRTGLVWQNSCLFTSVAFRVTEITIYGFSADLIIIFPAVNVWLSCLSDGRVPLTQSRDLGSTLSGTDNSSLCGTKREGETSGLNRQRGIFLLLEVLLQPCGEDLMHQRSAGRVWRYQQGKQASPMDTTGMFTWLILLFSLASWYLGSSVVTVYLSLFFS